MRHGGLAPGSVRVVFGGSARGGGHASRSRRRHGRTSACMSRSIMRKVARARSASMCATGSRATTTRKCWMWASSPECRPHCSATRPHRTTRSTRHWFNTYPSGVWQGIEAREQFQAAVHRSCRPGNVLDPAPAGRGLGVCRRRSPVARLAWGYPGTGVPCWGLGHAPSRSGCPAGQPTRMGRAGSRGGRRYRGMSGDRASRLCEGPADGTLDVGQTRAAMKSAAGTLCSGWE